MASMLCRFDFTFGDTLNPLCMQKILRIDIVDPSQDYPQLFQNFSTDAKVLHVACQGVNRISLPTIFIPI
jgi:hypothetical protein